MTKLSICIPNFNRFALLDNCLNSIKISSKKSNLDFEVCISDNNSDGSIEKVINKYENSFNIKLNKNKKNLGLGVNIMKSVSIASGDFAWIIGNDDLLLKDTLFKIEKLFENNKDVDFYYINSYHLSYSELKKYQSPFDTEYLKDFKMKKFSKSKVSKKMNFFNLVDPNISFDFLLGMFLCIFKILFRSFFLSRKKSIF